MNRSLYAILRVLLAVSALAALLLTGTLHYQRAAPPLPVDLRRSPRRAETIPARGYLVRELGVPGHVACRPRGLNARGQVVGAARTSDGTIHTVVFEVGVRSD